MDFLKRELKKRVYLENGQYNKGFLRRSSMVGMLFFILVMILASNLFVGSVSLVEGEVSESDIVAPRTTTYIDIEKTKQLEAEVIASVANVYDIDVSVSKRTDETIGAIFSAMQSDTVKSAEWDKRVELVADVAGEQVAEDTIKGLLSLSEESRKVVQDSSLTILHQYFQRGIHDNEVDLMKQGIAKEAEKLSLTNEQRRLTVALAKSYLTTNVILDQEATDQRVETALANMEPVRGMVQKGQILVRRGDVVTKEHVDLMTELGLYSAPIGLLSVSGVCVLVCVVIWLVRAYLRKFDIAVYRDDRQIFLIILVVTGSLFLGKMAHFYSPFAAPMAIGTLLLSILIGLRVGLCVGTALACFFCVMADFDVGVLISAFLGNCVAVYSISRLAYGNSLTRTGVMLGLFNFLVVGAIGVAKSMALSEVFYISFLALGGGILSAVITIGILPYLENAFEVTTPVKLIQIGQSNHPLLERLLLEAPGTHHHGLVVANLAEAAANEIGADPILVRIGAYYHDVGKLYRPAFFVENQFGGENPHDQISPYLSARILTAHARDGVALCREYNIPQVVIDIVQQHHGTTIAGYFYHKAKTEAEAEGLEVSEDDFRYDGPKPQTKEAALVMLADSCEAAVRSLGKPSGDQIEAMVRKIIRSRLQEGQLDECNVTLKDLSTIGDVFIRLLSSMFHTRIKYPETKELEGDYHANRNQQPTRKNDGDAGDRR